MRRRAHVLRGNKSREQPHSVVCLDTETWPDTCDGGRILHRLRFGWASFERTYSGNIWTEPEWFRFTRATDLWAWVESRTRPKTRTYVFAHNWSFDACVVDAFGLLPSRGWELKRAIIEAPPVILSWRRDDRTLEMLDTLNWWRTSLAKLAESIGLRKLQMPDVAAPESEWDVYARQDVEIVRQALHRWWSFLLANDFGGFARTLAGQAMRAYRHRFMDHSITLDDDTAALHLARESYHGGRVEAFRLGRIRGPVHCFDVNSMYPFVMREREYPATLARRLRRATPDDLSRWIERRCLVARVDVETGRNRFGLLLDGKLVFPVGRFRVSLTTPDIADALAHGEIRSVDEVCLYDRVSLFSRFVTELYSLRLAATEQGNDVQRYLLKILMNSLYGKFGQKGCVWENAGRDPERRVRVWREHDVVEGTTRLLRSFGGIVQEKLREEESRESHPAIASHVTAHGRALLWSLILAAGPSNVYYCDTDSLIVSDAGADRLASHVDVSRLGALKHEWSAPSLVIHGAKDYQTPSKRVIKGVRDKARWLDESTVEQERWSSLPGLVWDGDLTAPVTELQRKTLQRVYTKGDVGPGGAISPLALDWPNEPRTR